MFVSNKVNYSSSDFVKLIMLAFLAGGQTAHAPVVTYPREMDGVPNMCLPVFGLASYKFKGSLWTPNGGCERLLANSLLQAADNWLRLLQVNHPDFAFFCRRWWKDMMVTTLWPPLNLKAQCSWYMLNSCEIKSFNLWRSRGRFSCNIIDLYPLS